MESMQGFLLINLYAFLLIISTSIIFFSKKRLNQFEDNTYSKFLITNIFISFSGLILGILVNPTINIPSIIVIIFNKIYLVSLLYWISTLTLYTIFVSLKNKKNFEKLKKIFKIIELINVFLVIILPMSLEMVNSSAVPSGLAIIYTYSVFCIGFIVQIISVLRNYKNLKNKKYIPIYLLVTLGSLVVVNQIINPEMNYLLNPLFIFITVVMYHTIENPDIKLLSEVYKNKELVEQTYEDNSNFIFEMTQEVRNPIFNISNICNEIKTEEDIKVIKEKINSLSNTVRQLDFIVNDVLNVSTLDVQKVKFVDNRYNLKTLYDDVIAHVKTNIKNDIEFRTNIPNNVPYLYGDHIKLKQILYSLLMNSIKKTEKGFIEFKVDTINKYDVCRVIFTIVDSGSGIAVDKLNEVLSVTGEFDQNDIKELENTELNIKLCQKIIKVLGGNLLIKSKVGTGTEVLLVIDQRIHVKKEETDLIKYENSINTNRKVLLVSQDKEISKNIKRKLTDKEFSVSHLLSGLDAIDKIKSGKKYDFILIEDDMKEMNGFTTLKELKKLNKFNIPVIIMLKDNKLSIKEEYIKDGFKDYILLNNISVELDRIVDKY